MLRQLVSGLVCLVLVAGVALAEDKKDEKKGKNASGKFESYKDGVLKIKTGKKGQEKTEEFKVGDDLKVAVWANDEKKDVAAKDAFKDLKDGSPVAVTVDADGKVTAVRAGNEPKKTSGAFASFKDGTLTLKVKAKKGEETREYKLADDTKAVTLSSDGGKKEAGAKDALKDLKEGTPVSVTVGSGKDKKVLGIEVGTAKKKEKDK
jgi:hypothetical protein